MFFVCAIIHVHVHYMYIYIHVLPFNLDITDVFSLERCPYLKVTFMKGSSVQVASVLMCHMMRLFVCLQVLPNRGE